MWSIRLKSKRIWKQVTGFAALGLFVVPVLTSAQSVTQSYGQTGTIQQGMIVRTDPHNGSNIQALTNSAAKNMLGVVVAASDATVTLSSGATGAQAYVATTGKYDALVSTQNGTIKSGDYVSISALDGIGMKADDKEPVVLGKALEGFSAGVTGSSTAQLKTSGGTLPVSIGLITVDIHIAQNPLAPSGSTAGVPEFLQKLATAIAGKPVSAPRIYMSIGILLVSFMIAGSLLYGGVRSSLTAIGRNPLAKGSVLRGMSQVIFVGIIISVIGLAAVFLLLRL